MGFARLPLTKMATANPFALVHAIAYRSTLLLHARIQRGSGGRSSRPPPPWKITATGFLSNTAPDHLENHKATKPAFNVVGVMYLETIRYVL